MPLLDFLADDSPCSQPSAAESDSPAEGRANADGDAVTIQLKRKLQTSKARTAKAVKLALNQNKDVQEPSSYANVLQNRFFSECSSKNATRQDGSDLRQQFSRERSRCVWSLLQQLKETISSLFQSQKGIKHILHTCVCDDTSTRMKSGGLGRSQVYTVCNTVECTYVRFQDNAWEALFIPTPVRVLNSGKATSIHKAFTAWTAVSASGLGSVWRRLGLENDVLAHSDWKVCAFIGDALKANDSAWRMEGERRKRFIESQGPDKCCLGFRVRCCNHQLSLVRKPIALSVPHFWSTLVRLGHLFEMSSFRRSLATALVSMYHKDTNFIRT